MSLPPYLYLSVIVEFLSGSISIKEQPPIFRFAVFFLNYFVFILLWGFHFPTSYFFSYFFRRGEWKILHSS